MSSVSICKPFPALSSRSRSAPGAVEIFLSISESARSASDSRRCDTYKQVVPRGTGQSDIDNTHIAGAIAHDPIKVSNRLNKTLLLERELQYPTRRGWGVSHGAVPTESVANARNCWDGSLGQNIVLSAWFSSCAQHPVENAAQITGAKGTHWHVQIQTVQFQPPATTSRTYRQTRVRTLTSVFLSPRRTRAPHA